MRAYSITLLLLVVLFISSGILFLQQQQKNSSKMQPIGRQKVAGVQDSVKQYYWFELHRRSNKEYLYFGEPGNKGKSHVVKEFKVKSGVPGKKPTPLPELLGKEYWIVEEESDTSDSTETAPYFLKLNIPYSEEFPYGPVPYEECNGQCDWELPGSFGLHGTAGDPTKIADDNLGSSGCVRHSDEDITFLYNLLDTENNEIRYYIKDI